MTPKRQRAIKANAFLANIAGCGRRFFANSECCCSYFDIDARQRIWFVDSVSQQRVYTHWEGRWRGFTHGGTMKDLVKALRDYIRTGEKPTLHLGPWPEWICEGDLWGYG